jgi:hypothetical protein
VFSLKADCGRLAAPLTPDAIKSPSGDGCSDTPLKFNADCDRGSGQPTTVGGWMRPTSGLRAGGCIYNRPSIPPVRRSTSLCRLNATQLRLRDFSPKPWVEKSIQRRDGLFLLLSSVSGSRNTQENTSQYSDPRESFHEDRVVSDDRASVHEIGSPIPPVARCGEKSLKFRRSGSNLNQA